jgi:serine/threonine-protein kinase
MAACTRCATPLPDTSTECPRCGQPFDPAMATTALATGSVVGATSPSRSPHAPADAGSSYPPGTLLADRYRIVGLLGRGGMGEVHRADDLVLGQPVALKFLPPALERDPQRLPQFLGEIRNARQVAHPNVCRVYDVGSIGDQHFYSMEYVDGEDLSSLLRRIGRLPTDKGLEIARQLCAALGAVHDRSLLHRDLKPSNVMLDGRGKVRLTDFGLAAAGDGSAPSGVGGTPAYMAPEQFGGAPASVQSDLYALGLVLYEVFTGQRLFDSTNMAGLRAQQERFRPTDLSSTPVALDPAIERAIGRCLEREPRNRPPSAFAVAASLPGGDPLAAALAAGETPSPELVAAAGESRGLSPRAALLALAIVVAGIATILVTRASTGLLTRAPLPLSPDVLANKAEEMLARLGHRDRPADRAYEFVLDSEYVDYWTKQDKVRGLWPRLAGDRSDVVRFWYRSSPQPLVAQHFRMGGSVSGRVTPGDPPENVAGMISVSLDSLGRLRNLRAVPARTDDPADPPPAPFAWEALFREAGLDMAAFSASPPHWVPWAWGDQRASWRGPAPDTPTTTFEIEAAAYRGRPVFFVVASPWTGRGDGSGKGSTRPRDFVSVGMLVAVLLGGVLLARQNIVLGRGDRRGALRLGLAVVVINMAGWLFAASHVPDFSEIMLVLGALASALLSGALVWGAYIALEPHVRRHWPHALISWTRLLSGRPTDPLVGRDVVIGIGAGVVLALVNELKVLLQHRLGPTAPMPVVPRLGALGGLGSAAGLVPTVIFDSVFGSLLLFLVLFLLLLLVRRAWLAGLTLVGLIVLSSLANNDFSPTAGVLAAAMASGFILLLVRFGLLAFVVGEFVAAILISAPLSLDMSAWHWWTTVATLGVVAALSAYGFRAALAERSFLGRDAIPR